MFLPQRRLKGLGRRQVRKNPYIVSEYVDSFDWTSAKVRVRIHIYAWICIPDTYMQILHSRV